jgi:thioredoxin 1
MKIKSNCNIRNIFVILFFFTIFFVFACSHKTNLERKDKTLSKISTNAIDSVKNYKVTFIELGSIRCIPCQQMQSVMKSIEDKYGKEVKIYFYDVWTDAGKPYGVKYGIEAIPTQVFLDKTGKEYFRHVGFFPEDELVKILQMKDVKSK